MQFPGVCPAVWEIYRKVRVDGCGVVYLFRGAVDGGLSFFQVWGVSEGWRGLWVWVSGRRGACDGLRLGRKIPGGRGGEVPGGSVLWGVVGVPWWLVG